MVQRMQNNHAKHLAMLNAVTEYDRKESTKKYYNRYALSQYIDAINAVEDLLADEGLTYRQAILRCFNGRLADCVLKSVGEEKSTADEQRSGRWYR